MELDLMNPNHDWNALELDYDRSLYAVRHGKLQAECVRRLRESEPDLSDDLVTLLAALDSESDRGCILVGVAHVDECLEQLLRATFLDEGLGEKKPGRVGELLDAIGDGALGSLGARARAAYALGLLSTNEYHDIHLLTRMRNRCAHAVLGASFLVDQLSSWARELRCLPSAFKTTPRKRFEWCIMSLSRLLRERLALAKHVPARQEVDVDEAYAEAIGPQAVVAEIRPLPGSRK